MNDNGSEGVETEVVAPDEVGVNVVPIGGKPRRRAVLEEPLPAPTLNFFGAVPAGATYWTIHRAGLAGEFSVLSWGAPGDSLELREWPLADLSEAEIRRRWGAGIYKIQWLGTTPRGGRKSLNYGRTFTLRALDAPAAAVAAPAAAPVAAPSPMGESFDLAMRVMGMIETQAEHKVTAAMQFAQAMGGGSRGLGAAELQLILQNQAAATAAAIAAAVEPLHARLAALAADDDEDDGGGVGAAVAAAAPLIKGKGGWATALNFASANPEIVKTALPVVADMVGRLASLFAPPAPPPPPRPRAQVEMFAPPPAPAPVAPSSPPVDQASLSSWNTNGEPPRPLVVVGEAPPAS